MLNMVYDFRKYVEQTEYLLDENRHLEQQLESERKHSEDLQQVPSPYSHYSIQL